jgi:hypothetical protein
MAPTTLPTNTSESDKTSQDMNSSVILSNNSSDQLSLACVPSTDMSSSLDFPMTSVFKTLCEIFSISTESEQFPLIFPHHAAGTQLIETSVSSLQYVTSDDMFPRAKSASQVNSMLIEGK